MSRPERDHGGGVDAACARYGGTRAQWLDLSTGINPVPYPLPPLSADDWTALPDRQAQQDLVQAARDLWSVGDGFQIVAAPGASALIARLPGLWPTGRVSIPPPTYNEHAAAFTAAGWQINQGDPQVQVVVHPNNPDGHLWQTSDLTAPFSIIDESFCDVDPAQQIAPAPNRIILKSFGKFWGLAGVRLGFAIVPQDLATPLIEALGPWPVAGPALRIGRAALSDRAWADTTRARLAQDAARLDALMQQAGAQDPRGTSLFRLYTVDDAAKWQERLARHHIWTRIFPYSDKWIRLGLPAPDRWAQLEGAL